MNTENLSNNTEKTVKSIPIIYIEREIDCEAITDNFLDNPSIMHQIYNYNGKSYWVDIINKRSSS